MQKCCFLELLFLCCFSSRQNAHIYIDIQMVTNSKIDLRNNFLYI